MLTVPNFNKKYINLDFALMTIHVKRFLFTICSILATVVSSMVLALVQFHFLGRNHAVYIVL